MKDKFETLGRKMWEKVEKRRRQSVKGLERREDKERKRKAEVRKQRGK